MSRIRLSAVAFESENISDLENEIAAHVAKHGADAPRRKRVAVHATEDAHLVAARAESIDAQAEAEGAALDRMASYEDETKPLGRKVARHSADPTHYLPFTDVKAKYSLINGYVIPSISKDNPFAPNVDCLAKRREITADISFAPKDVIDSMVAALRVRPRRETTRKARAATTARHAAKRAARVQSQINTLRDQLIAKARAIVLARKSA